ncbi:MAG: glycerate kinase [Candidatus Binatia bacterium]
MSRTGRRARHLSVEASVPNAKLRGLRAEAAGIFRAAIAAVDPTRLVSSCLVRRGSQVFVQTPNGRPAGWPAPTLVIGAGKAAARMALGCEQALGAPNVHGEVIVPDGFSVALDSISVREAGHPLPDARGERATRRVLSLLRGPRAGGVLCLISGGASSLLVQPAPPLTLAEKTRTTQLLLACGADIGAVNAVRKHLSVVKGGGLLRCTAHQMVTLLISDVVGHDLSTIGSGPTAPDPTTFMQAWTVLSRHSLLQRTPAAVIRRLEDGMARRVPETVKPNGPEASRCSNLIVGSNRMALDGAARFARARGWMVHVEDAPLTGDTITAAAQFGSRLRELARCRSDGPGRCVLAGGETTVRVTGKGCGGRNQEFALALAPQIVGETVVVLSAGTDGIDGPTDAAGAFVDGTTLARARARGLSVETALADNDSYTFFSQLEDLFRCGPTGTNVMDIKVALIRAPAAPGSA